MPFAVLRIGIGMRVAILSIVCVLATGGREGVAAEELPKLGTSMNGTSVSGLSSGAYMAGQFHIAHSKSVVGAGIVAGGPFGCAAGDIDMRWPLFWPAQVTQNLTVALGACMRDTLARFGFPDVAALVDKARALARAGEIDPLDGLAGDRVYLFSGGGDRVVARSIVEAAGRFYARAGVAKTQIATATHDRAGHAFLTEDDGTACGSSETPFVSDCDLDQAGAILEAVYGHLAPPARLPGGGFSAFSQAPFAAAETDGFADEGMVYVPADCRVNEGCSVHIAFHGCRQSRDEVGDAFVKSSGFARWTDTNRLVVLFPQVRRTAVNPKGCWDWWGYTGLDYLTKEGAQISAVWRMLERLAERATDTGPTPPDSDAAVDSPPPPSN